MNGPMNITFWKFNSTVLAIALIAGCGANAPVIDGADGNRQAMKPSKEWSFRNGVAEFQQRFTYQSDPVDHWTVLPGQGPVAGDSEDYALTLQLAIGGKLWLVQDAESGFFNVALCTTGVDKVCTDPFHDEVFELSMTDFDFMLELSRFDVKEIIEEQEANGGVASFGFYSEPSQSR